MHNLHTGATNMQSNTVCSWGQNLKQNIKMDQFYVEKRAQVTKEYLFWLQPEDPQ